MLHCDLADVLSPISLTGLIIQQPINAQLPVNWVLGWDPTRAVILPITVAGPKVTVGYFCLFANNNFFYKLYKKLQLQKIQKYKN